MKVNTKLTTLRKKAKKGFTLIEVIAVLVLLGILAAIALPKYINMAEEARATAITAGVAELNSREALTWGKESLKDGGWSADVLPSTDLGTEYNAAALDEDGGDLIFQTSTTTTLTRAAATADTPGVWSEPAPAPAP